jgi:hypothetical protein
MKNSLLMLMLMLVIMPALANAGQITMVNPQEEQTENEKHCVFTRIASIFSLTQRKAHAPMPKLLTQGMLNRNYFLSRCGD